MTETPVEPLSAEEYIAEADLWARIQPSDPGTVATAQVYATLAVAAALRASRESTEVRSLLAPPSAEAGLRKAVQDVLLQEGRHRLGRGFATVPKAALDRLRAALAQAEQKSAER